MIFTISDSPLCLDLFLVTWFSEFSILVISNMIFFLPSIMDSPAPPFVVLDTALYCDEF